MIEQRREPDGVRVAVLNRPPANAIDESLLDDLSRVVVEVGADDSVRALVLAGAGPFFCAGFDLRAPRRDEEAGAHMVARYRDAHRALLALSKPTVAVVEGHAIAGGLVLALACDFRVFAEGDYAVGLNELAIGAAFPTVAMEIVRLRLTHAAASELILGAQLLKPADAVRLGLVASLTPPAAAYETAVELASRIGAFPREPFAHAKREVTGDALMRVDAVSFDAELAIADLWLTDESRAARHAQRRRLEKLE